jgi:predicted transcriptional regulator
MRKAFEVIPEEFVSDTSIYDFKISVTEAVEKIGRHGAVIVRKNNTYYGIVDDRSLTRKANFQITKNMSIGNFAEKTPILYNGSTIENAIVYFYNSARKALPYHNGKKISGIVKREKILDSILSLHLLRDFIVKDAMTSPVIGIDSRANIAQAKDVMVSRNLNRLVVLENAKLFGIITYKDLMSIMASPNERAPSMTKSFYNPSNTQVGSICIRNVNTIDPEKSIEDAIRKMLNDKVSSLLVLKNGKPTGILTMKDIFELVVANLPQDRPNIIISGLDEYTKEYEEEIRTSLTMLFEKLNKMHKFSSDYVSINIKRNAPKNNYSIKARIMSYHGKSFSASSEGFTLDQAMKNLTGIISKEIKKNKEMIITGTREKERPEEYE